MNRTYGHLVCGNRMIKSQYKSKLNIRAKNSTFNINVYNKKQTSSTFSYELFSYILIFWYNFKLEVQEKLRRKNEDSFPKKSIGHILNEICILQILPTPKIVTTYIHFISCIDKSSISLKRVKCLVIKKKYNFAIEYEMSKP